MKKNTILLIIIILSSFHFYGQTLDWIASADSGTTYGYNNVCYNNEFIYTTGISCDTVDFQYGPGTNIIISNFSWDVLILKQDTEGNIIWVKTLTGNDSEYGASIDTDTQGNVYVIGSFRDTVDFDPGPGTYSISAIDTTDIFLIKLNPDGELIWVKTFAASNIYLNYYKLGLSVKLDNNNDVIIGGNCAYTIDLDPGPLVYNYISHGNRDIFIVKLNSDGEFIWGKGFGGEWDDFFGELNIDSFGNIYSTGNFVDNVDFDPGPNVYNLISTGSFYDIYLNKLSSEGGFIWAKALNGNGYQLGSSITIDRDMNVYATGIFEFSVDFDPGPNSYILASNGYEDFYVLKLDISGNFIWAKAEGGIGHDGARRIRTDSSGMIYITGSYTGSVDFDPSHFDQIYTAFCYDRIFIQKLDSTGQLEWVISPEGQYFGTGTSVCIDNINNVFATGAFNMTADFNPDPWLVTTFNPSGSKYYSAKYEQCYSKYEFADTSCTVYTLNGIDYTSSGNYIQILTNSQGCDSILRATLTVVHPNIFVMQYPDSLFANMSNAQYQWLDCNNNFAPVPGATNRSYKPTESGSYAVEIIVYGCIDTSACYTVTVNDIDENELMSDMETYPNPTKDYVFIIGLQERDIVRLYDILGNRMQVDCSGDNPAKISLNGLSGGVYFLKIKRDNMEKVFKILKE